MRIALLSTDGRDDICEGFVKFAERFWTDRPWPIEAIVGNPEGSYCKRITSYLNSIPEEILMVCIDDFWPYPTVDQKAINRAYDHILRHESVGAIHLLHCVSTGNACYQLPGFQFIGIADSYRSSNGGMLVRKKYLLEITGNIGRRLTPEQDAGIIGMTYWEQNANQAGAKWDVLCPLPTNQVLPRINAACEAQWRHDTIELVAALRIDLDMTKRAPWDGTYPHGDKLRTLDGIAEVPC